MSDDSQTKILDRAILARRVLLARCTEIEQVTQDLLSTLLTRVTDQELTYQQAMQVQKEILNGLDRYVRKISETI